MNQEPRAGKAESRDERVTTWFEKTRETLSQLLISLEISYAEATDDNDRAKLLRLQRDMAVLEGRISHLDELAFGISAVDESEQISHLENDASKLDALLTQQNKTADALEGQITFRGGMHIDTQAAILRAQLLDTRDLLLEYI